jgi:hypothetical protein
MLQAEIVTRGGEACRAEGAASGNRAVAIDQDDILRSRTETAEADAASGDVQLLAIGAGCDEDRAALVGQRVDRRLNRVIGGVATLPDAEVAGLCRGRSQRQDEEQLEEICGLRSRR